MLRQKSAQHPLILRTECGGAALTLLFAFFLLSLLMFDHTSLCNEIVNMRQSPCWWQFCLPAINNALRILLKQPCLTVHTGIRQAKSPPVLLFFKKVSILSLSHCSNSYDQLLKHIPVLESCVHMISHVPMAV